MEINIKSDKISAVHPLLCARTLTSDSTFMQHYLNIILKFQSIRMPNALAK